MKVNVYKLKGHFKGLLFVIAVLIIIVLLVYNYRIVRELRAESRQILLLYAQLYASAAEAESSSNLNFIFDQIILRTNFPIVLTDPEGNPSAWKGIDIDPADRSEAALAHVTEMLGVMAQEAEPIQLKYQDILIGHLYYGDSKLIKKLQLLPYVGIVVIGLFLLIAFLGFRSLHRGEEQLIWVGMSKETAHQIGTPLSSIMGWIALLRERLKDRGALDTIEEMEKDVERLSKITARFSQIGSKADLRDTLVNAVLMDVVSYFQKRLPQWGKKVDIQVNCHSEQTIPLNRELFEWVVENLVKNSLDALDKNAGTIKVILGTLNNGRHRIYIDITDDGRGIDSANKKNVFKPGFSTKKRGWGLGLSLAKRIVEDYHGGKLFVKETKPDHGTTMRIIL